MDLKSRELSEESFANRLVRAGYNDFYVIGQEDARRLLTDKRMELIKALKEKEMSSKRSLARHLDRDIKQVSEDLEILHQMSIVEFREKGNRKIPELRHDKIFVEPIG